MLFYDRFEAGKMLARKLLNYKNHQKAVVLSLPRGGVPIGYEIAAILKLPLDVFLVRKLGVPKHEEVAMGAISLGNVCLLNQELISRLEISGNQINQVISREMLELERRNELYRQGKDALDLKGFTVILVDDGIATGFTIKAAIEAIKKQKPKQIIIASPVIPEEVNEELLKLVDDVVAIKIADNFKAVGIFYAEFDQTTDRQVLELLEKSKHIKLGDKPENLTKLIKKNAIEFKGSHSDYDDIIELAKDAKFVLLGESTHGTKEFYNIRAEISKRLISEYNFDAVVIEGDWPDAYRINDYVKKRLGDDPTVALSVFQRFPTWMWQNKEMQHFVKWLYAHNQYYGENRGMVGFYGMDLYSMNSSIAAVISYLEKHDKKAAQIAKVRYSCLERYMERPHLYRKSSEVELISKCEDAIVAQLVEMRRHEFDHLQKNDEEEFFSAKQNAKLIKNAENYYRALYCSNSNTWNLRDTHMADTVFELHQFLSKKLKRPAKLIIWAHNSHIGDASATDMQERGEINIGQLIRKKHPDDTILIGFSTYDGTVTAADEWDGDMKKKIVLPAIMGSHADIFHKSGIGNFALIFKDNSNLTDALNKNYLQRFIGVIYRPDTEYYSHYYHAKISKQFDAIIHIDKTSAVEPLHVSEVWHQGEFDETYPFGI